MIKKAPKERNINSHRC